MEVDDKPPVRTRGERLIDVYRRFGNPELTGLEEPMLEAFERFLGLPDWIPADPYLGSYDRPFELGAMYAFLQHANAEENLSEARTSFLAKGFVDAPLRAELSAGALLRRLNCDAMFVPKAKVRTPDITIEWGCQTVDIEVVAGQRKPSNRALQGRLGDLSRAIDLRSEADVLVFLNRELSDETFDEVVRVSGALAVGETCEAENLWRVAALPPAGRAIDEFATAARKEAQPWWWARPTMFAVRTVVGEEVRRVDVGTTFPIEDYLNPVLRKANRPQRSSKANPYVIALDVSSIPNAQQAVVQHVLLAMTTWEQVSAVLLFYDFFPSTGAKAWRALLLRNAAAIIPLPDDFLPDLGEKQQSIAVEELPALSSVRG